MVTLVEGSAARAFPRHRHVPFHVCGRQACLTEATLEAGFREKPRARQPGTLAAAWSAALS